MPITEVLNTLFQTLEVLDIPYLVGGSFASGAWGQPRQTNDIDIAIQLGPADVEGLVLDLSDMFMINAEEIFRTLEDRSEHRSFQLLHFGAGFKVDVFVPIMTEYRRSEFERAHRVEILPGVQANCSGPENVVIQKIRWYELGRRVSDRQWNDIVQVLEIQKGQLDEDYLDHWAQHFEIEELLASARHQVRA